MASSVLISFRPSVDADFLHKVRNFGEALSRGIAPAWGRLPMEQADVAERGLEVSAIPARKVRRVLRLVEEMLGAHYLEAAAVVEAVLDPVE